MQAVCERFFMAKSHRMCLVHLHPPTEAYKAGLERQNFYISTGRGQKELSEGARSLGKDPNA